MASTVKTARDRFRIEPLDISELVPYASQKLFSVPLSKRLVTGVPAFVVEATDQHRELCHELRDLVHRQPIA
jgi:hypothetical protein